MGRLTIQEIAKVLITKNGLEQSEANRFATELFAIIQERLEKNDLVKVKGLGTFKVITVEARESVSVRTGDRVMIGEHSKITFTPDATMKELVNKPFSQFETVLLNENVEFDDLKEHPTDNDFDDIKDDLNEEELVQLEQLEQLEEPAIKEEQPDEPAMKEEQPEEPTNKEEVPEESSTKDEESEDTSTVAPLIEITEEQPEEVKVTSENPVSEEDENDSHSWSKWIWIAFAAICIACLSATGGYYYGCKQTALYALSDTVIVCDTVYVPEYQDTAIVEEPVEPIIEQNVSKVEESQVEKSQKEEPQIEKPKPASEVDKYAAMDERVRLGAYRIVGLDHEVKVQPGQTFYSICRAHLGPDMECYIEVYNDLPRNPQIKAGQVIKIPKLQLKKRKKQ
jgi:nucleoid DNA-binding protein/LysM repeat protein